MAVTWALEAQSHSASVSSDGKPVFTYKEKYVWKNDTGSFVGCHATRLNFQASTGIIPGSGYVDNSFAICRGINVTKQSSVPPHQLWDIEVEWSTEASEVEDENPANRKWVRGVVSSSQQRFIYRDINDQLIVDAAGSPFDGGIPVDVEMTTYTWKHNVDWDEYDTDTIGYLSGSINSDTFLGKPPYTLKLTYTADEQWEGKYHFAAETYTMIYDPYGWKPKPVNAGLFYLNSGVRTRIKDAAGKDAVEPEPLTAAGAVVPVSGRPQDCTFIEVDFYRELPFSTLNLPTV